MNSSPQDRPRLSSEALLLASLAWNRLFPAQGIPILCYHRIADHGSISTVTPAAFRRQMQLLQAWGFRTLALQELVTLLSCGHPLPRWRVVLTFDDGYACFYHEASTVLREMGFTASVFVPTDYVGLPASWNKRVAAAGGNLLSWEEIKELAQAGFSFYPHGLSHRRLTQLSNSELERELRGSRELLEARLGQPATVFCYPYGDCDARAERAARAAGFQAACGLRPGLNRSANQLWNLRRMMLLRTTSPRGFRARVTGAFSRYAGLRGWLRGSTSLTTSRRQSWRCRDVS